MKHTEVAIIGAGVTGLAAASRLSPRNYRVFEKSRGPGGRLASKRMDAVRADIGAQFFTVRDHRFQVAVDSAVAAGFVTQWQPNMGTFRDHQPIASPDHQARFVGHPYMNSLGRFLSQDIEIQTESRVQTIEPDGDLFRLILTSQETLTADCVLVTAPVDQMVAMLQHFDVEQLGSRFAMDPTWTTVLSVEEPLRGSAGESFDALFGGDHPLFDFIAVENSKPGRQSNFIIVHATPEWSTQHLESDPAEISELIREALSETFQGDNQGKALTPVAICASDQSQIYGAKRNLPGLSKPMGCW
jgi:predicted NAD/FAD-dependent oxidoreductase